MEPLSGKINQSSGAPCRPKSMADRHFLQEDTLAGIRTFVAIKLDAHLCDGLDTVMDNLREHMPARSVRWSSAHKIHLTLKFLGDIGPSQIAPMQEALREAAGQIAPFSFELKGLGCFPHTGRPRVIWIGVNEPTRTLNTLQKAVENALHELGFEREKRAFSPHLTLGRVRNEVRHEERREIGQIVESTRLDTLCRQDVASIHLFKSDLQPGGAVYTSLAELPLGSSNK